MTPGRIPDVGEIRCTGMSLHLDRFILGGVAGALATWPMTVTMAQWHRHLPPSEQYPLPPRLITMNLAAQAGVKSEMNAEDRFTATILAHYGYGAGSGALYGLFPPMVSSPLLNGVLFGIGVWTVSYFGLLPALGLFRAAPAQPFRRNLLMLGAHVVWGGMTGLFFRALNGPPGRERTKVDTRPPLSSRAALAISGMTMNKSRAASSE